MAVKFANNNSLSAITSLPASVSGGAWTLLSTQTASSSSTVDFTSGIDSTYKEYIFKFINMHGDSDAQFKFQANASGGSGFNETITSTLFRAYHLESGSATGLGYQTSGDQTQGTSYNSVFFSGKSGDNDSSGSGTLHLFDPSNTTFVKHFISSTVHVNPTVGPVQTLVSGYFNTTSAIDEISFKMHSGNIDSGTIIMYGVS
jgi:hypothetical protein